MNKLHRIIRYEIKKQIYEAHEFKTMRRNISSTAEAQKTLAGMIKMFEEKGYKLAKKYLPAKLVTTYEFAYKGKLTGDEHAKHVKTIYLFYAKPGAVDIETNTLLDDYLIVVDYK